MRHINPTPTLPDIREGVAHWLTDLSPSLRVERRLGGEVKRFFFISILTLLLVACGSSSNSPTDTPESRSIWGDIITIAQAEQSNAPTIIPLENRVMLGWVSRTDATLTQQLAQYTFDDQRLEVYPQPFVLIYPHAQGLIPATPNITHLLWLDAQHDNLADGKRLWVAPISGGLFSERLQTMVSDIRVNNYTALAHPDGSLTVIYSGGLVAEPSLYIQSIDSLGRPQLDRETLTFNADHPTVIRANDGAQHLFWNRPIDGQLFHAQVVDHTLENITPIGEMIPLGITERLVDFTIALDQSHFYAFWTIDRLNGQIESWYATMPINGDTMTAPQRLGLTITPDSAYETGFNGGIGQSATVGETYARWASPLSGQYERLAVSAQVGDSLGVIYFEAGAIVGYQAVVNLTHDLVGFPQLQTDINRHLYLAWSAPTDGQFADLNLTMTR